MRHCLAIGMLLVVAVAHAAQGQGHFRPSESWRSDEDPPRWYRATPGDLYRPAWEYARACSGLEAQGGGDYDDVTWLVVSSGGLRDRNGDRIIGVWLAPDTIVLDSLWIEAAWLVAHELLHHLRHIANDPNPHPYDPFVWPCMLTFVQNAPHRSSAGRRIVGPSSAIPGSGFRLEFIGEARREEAP